MRILRKSHRNPILQTEILLEIFLESYLPFVLIDWELNFDTLRNKVESTRYNFLYYGVSGSKRPIPAKAGSNYRLAGSAEK